MITIVTVNFHSNDFRDLLLESIDRFSIKKPEIIIIENSKSNIGHGEGLNLGASLANSPYTMFLDIDTHFLIYGWDEILLQAITKFDIIFGKGVDVKPVRPACMFMKTEIAKKYDWRATPGYQGHRITPEGYDVGIKAYYKIKEDNLKYAFFETQKNHYGTANGEEFSWNKLPFIYHHWHGTHLSSRQVDFPLIDLQDDKKKLFDSIPWRIL